MRNRKHFYRCRETYDTCTYTLSLTPHRYRDAKYRNRLYKTDEMISLHGWTLCGICMNPERIDRVNPGETPAGDR